jgi:hypothetical protein
MMRAIAFAVILALALVAYWAPEHSAPNAGLPVIHADYRQCVMIQTGPLRPPRDTDPYHHRRSDFA